jgi:ubiquinone/menaquinone biosynthesis C-methylase UbiE
VVKFCGRQALSLDTDARSADPLDFESRYPTAGARRALAYEQKVVIEALGPLRPGVLLDVGTGPGRLINFPPPPEVVGIDFSEDDLGWATERYSGDASKHFVLGIASSLPFRDDAFDEVLSIRVIKFLEDPEAAISEMAEVLKPGGRLVVDISNKFSPSAFIRRLGSWMRIRPPSRAYFTHGDGLKMMVSVGLTPFTSRPLFKVDPSIWTALHNERLVRLVESVEGLLDKRTGTWFLSRYVVIACEKPFTSL